MIENAKQMPRRFYGLHFCEGVAEYETVNGKPQRILITEEVARTMDPSFEGKPLYVGHVDTVELDKLEQQMAGTVVRSFYNPADGRHWCEFMVTSDQGHEAIAKKWKLSNAYAIVRAGGGGSWHNVDYQQEVLQGEYRHLAIVQNPRYEESIILTPDEFKEYNLLKETELRELANAKDGEQKPMFKFFKKTVVENAKDLESYSVTLSTGSEKTIAELVNDAEAMAKRAGMCNMDDKVKVGEDEMSVNELVEKYQALVAKANEEDKDGKDEDGKAKPAEPLAEDSKNADDEAAKKKKDEDDAAAKKNAEDEEAKNKKDAEEKANEKKRFEELKNAADKVSGQGNVVETSGDKLNRGKSRYGSGR